MHAPSPTTHDATQFEAAIEAADAAVRHSNKRARDVALQARRLLRRPPSVREFPFHDEDACLDAALEAVAVVTGVPSPNFDKMSDPRCVYRHICEAVIKYGDDCREEGRGIEREGAEPRIPADAALQAMTLMSHLNDLLSAWRLS